MTASRPYWLSMHVPYACRHSGACCSSGWAIPVERARVAAIERVAAREKVAAATWLLGAPNAPADIAGVLATREDGRCVFFRGPDRPAAGSCAIHGALGHAALPAACQHFPRECLIDARGVFVTLSHYCPTAAELLFSHAGPVEIVVGPPPCPDGEPEGLDARDVLPPLLAPGVLTDLAGYAAWEAHMVRTLAGDAVATGQRTAEQAVHLLERQAQVLSQWRPGSSTLADAVAALASPRASAGDVADLTEGRRLFDLARAALPRSYSWPAIPQDVESAWRTCVSDSWAMHQRAIGRFLAAHAFASWMAYQGSGLLSLLRRIRTALAVLRLEAARATIVEKRPLTQSMLKHSIRQTDLLLVHLVDRDALAARLV
jgi:hypothetical protein